MNNNNNNNNNNDDDDDDDDESVWGERGHGEESQMYRRMTQRSRRDLLD